jgi:hypothetical protein
MIQERIVDQVRAVEFDMESVSDATVGSLPGVGSMSGFERIADDDASMSPSAKKRKAPPRHTASFRKPREEKSDERARNRKRKKLPSPHGQSEQDQNNPNQVMKIAQCDRP